MKWTAGKIMFGLLAVSLVTVSGYVIWRQQNEISSLEDVIAGTIVPPSDVAPTPAAGEPVQDFTIDFGKKYLDLREGYRVIGTFDGYDLDPLSEDAKEYGRKMVISAKTLSEFWARKEGVNGVNAPLSEKDPHILYISTFSDSYDAAIRKLGSWTSRIYTYDDRTGVTNKIFESVSSPLPQITTYDYSMVTLATYGRDGNKLILAEGSQDLRSRRTWDCLLPWEPGRLVSLDLDNTAAGLQPYWPSRAYMANQNILLSQCRREQVKAHGF